MKFRCTHNSIRLRLRKSEIHELKQKAIVKEHLIFNPEQQLVVALCIDEKATQIGAQFANNNIMVSLPEGIAKDWITTDKISLEAILATHPTSSPLSILVEKDLSCKGGEEDKSDYFDELGSKAC